MMSVLFLLVLSVWCLRCQFDAYVVSLVLMLSVGCLWCQFDACFVSLILVLSFWCFCCPLMLVLSVGCLWCQFDACVVSLMLFLLVCCPCCHFDAYFVFVIILACVVSLMLVLNIRGPNRLIFIYNANKKNRMYCTALNIDNFLLLFIFFFSSCVYEQKYVKNS